MTQERTDLHVKIEWYLNEHTVEDLLQALKTTESHAFLGMLTQYEIPKKYKDEWLNSIFRYDEEIDLTEDEWYFMYQIRSKVFENKDNYISVCLKDYEYNLLGKSGLYRVLRLLHQEYEWDVTFYPEAKSYEDVVVVSIYYNEETF